MELDTIMKNHLQPTSSRITERNKFEECKQSEGQNIKHYLAMLKKLSKNCDFGENLESRMRDQFVSGLHSAAMKQRLLGEPNLTYLRAIELATALESATKSSSSEQPSVCSILDLPKEILVKIILHFDPTNRLALGKSCRRFNDLVFGDSKLLRNLDFTGERLFAEESDIQQYFNNENTSRNILEINLKDVWAARSLSNSIGKAINLVELNILNGLRFESVEELSRFLKPLVHLRRLSVDWPRVDWLDPHFNPDWIQLLEKRFSRLTYLSLRMNYYFKDFILILRLCQQLEELRMSMSIRVDDFEGPLRQDPMKLSNLKFVRLSSTDTDKTGQLRRYIMSIIADAAEWTDFYLAEPDHHIYLEKNVEVCPELSRVREMPLPEYAARYRRINSIDKGWALVPEHLFSEVFRLTHEGVPEKFCCLSHRGHLLLAEQPYLLQIDEAKKLLKDSRHRITSLNFRHVIERNCDVHLVASAFPYLTELGLSWISNENVPESAQPLSRRLRKKGSLASEEEHSDAKNTDSSFKILVENTPQLKVLKIICPLRLGYEQKYWDYDALSLISGWKNLTAIHLSSIGIPDGKFLINIGIGCEKLEEIMLQECGLSETQSYESELLQMLPHCKNLRKLSIVTWTSYRTTEMFGILSNCSRFAALHLQDVDLIKCDCLELSSSVEKMLRQCREWNEFFIDIQPRETHEKFSRAVERIISELNRPNFKLQHGIFSSQSDGHRYHDEASQ